MWATPKSDKGNVGLYKKIRCCARTTIYACLPFCVCQSSGATFCFVCLFDLSNMTTATLDDEMTSSTEGQAPN